MNEFFTKTDLKYIERSYKEKLWFKGEILFSKKQKNV